MTTHAENAGRFMLLADALDTIRPKYRRVVPPHQPAANYPATLPNRAYLDVHLEFITTRHSAKVGNCTVSNLQDGHDDNPRVALPSTIINLMRANNCQWSTSVSQKPKVPVTWIVCYLNGNRPDNTAQSEWTRQEVSHRCIHGKCITPSHLCWESKAQNQSRGNKFCSRRCIHEDCQAINVCDCQKFHIPCCI